MAGVKGKSGGTHKPRLSPRVMKETRDKIDTTTIINKLNKHVKGELEMESTQIRAAEILLKKTLPDLQAITHSGDEDEPIQVHHTGLPSLMARINSEVEQARAKNSAKTPSKN